MARSAAPAGLGRLRAVLPAGGEHWFAVASAVVNGGNFLFFAIVGHFLRPAQYGAVASLLSIVSLANIPLNALQAVVVQEMLTRRRDAAAEGLPPLSRGLIILALAPTFVLALLSPVLAGFLGIGSVLPVLELAAWFAPSIVGALYLGVMMAASRWSQAAIAMIGGAVARVLVAVALGAVWANINGPVLATLMNALLTLYLLWGLRGHDAGRRTRAALTLALRTLAPTLAALSSYALLLAVDTLLARHILGHAGSGAYAAAATAAKVALIIPTTAAIVIFPRLVAAHAAGVDARPLLLRTLGVGLGLGLVAAAGMALLAHLIVTVMFGHQYAEAASILRVLGFQAALLGGLGIVTYYHVSRHSIAAALPLLCVVEVAVLALVFRPDRHGLALLMACSVAGATLISTVVALLPGRIAMPQPLPDQRPI